jgi:hypothetical protein
MGIVIGAFLFIAVSFLFLRALCLMSKDRRQSQFEIFVLGITTWVFLLAAGAWLFVPLYFIFDLFANKNYGSLYPLMFVGMATGLAFQTNEVLDSASVLHHIRESAFFRPLKPHTMIVQEELEKKKIRDIHREISGKPFPTIGKQKRLLTDTEAAQFRQQMQAAGERPPRSSDFESEIKALQSGATTNLSDPWKVYTFDHKLHDLYAEMSEVHLDPRARTLRFRLNIHGANEPALQNPVYVYQLKQDLYHFLHVLNTDPWLASYVEFFDHIVAVCFGIESDSFGHVQMYPFLRIDIARSQLSDREGKFFNAADLHTICTLTFENGKPLQGELT